MFTRISLFICHLAGWLNSDGYSHLGQNIGLERIPYGDDCYQD
jgi:hypothetical protein